MSLRWPSCYPRGPHRHEARRLFVLDRRRAFLEARYHGGALADRVIHDARELSALAWALEVLRAQFPEAAVEADRCEALETLRTAVKSLSRVDPDDDDQPLSSDSESES